MMKWVVLTWCCVLCCLVNVCDAAYVTTLSVKNKDELKKAIKGGQCWLIACTDMKDNEIGERLVAQAGDSLDGECNLGSMKCRQKVDATTSFASKCVS